MDSDNNSYHSKKEFYYPDEISYFLNVNWRRLEHGCSENSAQKLLTKYSREENNKHVICRPANNIYILREKKSWKAEKYI